MKIFTIGVYNSTELQFFKKLSENNIDTFCDIRQRRGGRGREYAFVLRKSGAKIYYGHINNVFNGYLKSTGSGSLFISPPPSS